jgi:hypothetical protein
MEKQWEYNGRVHQLFTDYEKAYKVRREVLYNILNEFGIPMKLVRIIKMSLNKTYSKVHMGKNVSDAFPIQNGLKQGYALLPLLVNFTICYQEGPRKSGWGKSMEYISSWSVLMILMLGENRYTVKKKKKKLC